MKRCSKCKTERPLTEFHKDKYRPDGIRIQCISCTRAYGKKYREKYPHDAEFRTHQAAIKRVSSYGLSYVEARNLKNVCEICGKTDLSGRDLHVDHCHKTKVYRGILCRKCNAGIGFLQDDVTLIISAMSYLLKSLHRIANIRNKEQTE